MSDLFRSALGYLSSSTTSATSSSSGGGVYNSASGGSSEETSALGEVITFSANGHNTRSVRITKLIAEGEVNSDQSN